MSIYNDKKLREYEMYNYKITPDPEGFFWKSEPKHPHEGESFFCIVTKFDNNSGSNH